jgi:REP element-mobilizing transposase RayT
MARIARIVVPGIPHHITQRGNRRMQTFFEDDVQDLPRTDGPVVNSR